MPESIKILLIGHTGSILLIVTKEDGRSLTRVNPETVWLRRALRIAFQLWG